MPWDLIADIGGTNMRLAAVRDHKIVDQQTFPTVGELSIDGAVSAFTGSQGSSPINAAIAAAGIVDAGAVTLTNTGSRITQEMIRVASGTKNAKILNDFEAAAWSLADIDQNDIRCLQGSADLVRGARLIVGPGTGLGVGGLVWDGDNPVVVQGEGGHVRLAPESLEEFEIYKALIAIWPEIQMGNAVAMEAEAVVSGTGLPYLYRAICSVMGLEDTEKSAQQIFTDAKNQFDRAAETAIALFTKSLAQVAGDMAITFSAKGGVFLSGGVLSSNQWIFDQTDFLDVFNAGGRHSGFRKSLPVYLYSSGQFGLNGAINYLKYQQ